MSFKNVVSNANKSFYCTYRYPGLEVKVSFEMDFISLFCKSLEISKKCNINCRLLLFFSFSVFATYIYTLERTSVQSTLSLQGWYTNSEETCQTLKLNQTEIFFYFLRIQPTLRSFQIFSSNDNEA